MTSDNGPAKAKPAPKAASAPSEAAAKPKASEAAAKPKESEAAAKPEASTPASYSRGEGQKPVTNAYKENWNLIYGKKKKKKPSR
jgi:hypothetical protein